MNTTTDIWIEDSEYEEELYPNVDKLIFIKIYNIMLHTYARLVVFIFY